MPTSNKYDIDLNDRRRADARGWGQGWPSCAGAKGNVVVVVLSNGVRLGVHRRIAPIIRALCEEGIRRGYLPRDGQSWGGACRAIRGTQTPSNHSWWMAVDINSLANPMGPTLVTDMPAWYVEAWEALGFRWGGRYSGRKDAMHFEFMGTPEQADAIVRDLLATMPAPTPVPLPEEDEMFMVHAVDHPEDKGAIILVCANRTYQVLTPGQFWTYVALGVPTVALKGKDNDGHDLNAGWNEVKTRLTKVA